MRNQGLGSWLVRRLEKSGPRAAVIHGERTLTYRELHDRSRRLATALSGRGVGPGDRSCSSRYVSVRSPWITAVLEIGRASCRERV